MKYILIGIIKVYQMIPFSFHGMCKFIPSCSNYAIEALKIHGSFHGSILSIKRILRCNPKSIGGIDPVPERKVK